MSRHCAVFGVSLGFHLRLWNFHCLFFFNDTATTEIYTLSLHDALPISGAAPLSDAQPAVDRRPGMARRPSADPRDPGGLCRPGYAAHAAGVAGARSLRRLEVDAVDRLEHPERDEPDEGAQDQDERRLEERHAGPERAAAL